MKYDLLKDTITLLEQFESENVVTNKFSSDINGFKQWINLSVSQSDTHLDLHWDGKNNGRSSDSIINTLIVHLNRYAKAYSKAAIFGSKFSTQEDFIYLIVLKANGRMTKMELIKKNIHDKPAGMKIIDRLIQNQWIQQEDSLNDKRSKQISLTTEGFKALDLQMDQIRKATKIVTGNLENQEKMQLIRLLQKLDHFHEPIYKQNLLSSDLIDVAYQKYCIENNLDTPSKDENDKNEA